MPVYLPAFELYVHLDDKLAGLQKFINCIGTHRSRFLREVRFILHGQYWVDEGPTTRLSQTMRISRLLAVQEFKATSAINVQYWIERQMLIGGRAAYEYGRAFAYRFK